MVIRERRILKVCSVNEYEVPGEKDHTSTTWGRQDFPIWCHTAARRSWLHHHTIPHSAEKSAKLNAHLCTTSEKILPFLTPGRQVKT
ncbi:hypothetical protein AV530_016307 [Patagioenas fasciata monilis]|uniref:Uncharacterized protein n=1 Tax=Patagioenas fasciata monilis TaxID=372326 RepID=A0A1V4JWZ8_PATFA|nr:hypothetical protein AV530_016307 [Patagioenas fasciata monilis]